MKTWADIGFEIEITGDGSPSLRLLRSVDPNKYRGESMHHSGGACAETNLIYAEPVAELLQKKTDELSFIVVGLGLGYIELCLARQVLLAGHRPENIKALISYESLPELRHFFWAWLWEERSGLSLEVQRTYDQVVQFVLLGTSLTARDLKDFLKFHLKSVNDIKGSLDVVTPAPVRAHGIFYDAFSSKTTPHLWDELFLLDFLSQSAAESLCVFSTYACRASLKRALQKNSFEVQVRPGFQGKRNSTLAWRSKSLQTYSRTQ